MWIQIAFLSIITLIVLTFRKSKYMMYGYMTLLGFLLILDAIVYGMIDIPITTLVKFIFESIVVTLVAVLYYVIDFIAVNMVRQRVLLLDLKYIFSGSIRWRDFLISFFIAGGEELVFRYYVLFESLEEPFLPLLLSSVLFGLVHIVFSSYDVVSKTILGLLCGVIFIVTGNIVITILFHLIYNYFTLKGKKG